MWQMAWLAVVKTGRRGISENYRRSKMDRMLWRIWCGGKEECILRAVTWTLGHIWMMRVSFTEETLEDNQVTGRRAWVWSWTNWVWGPYESSKVQGQRSGFKSLRLRREVEVKRTLSSEWRIIFLPQLPETPLPLFPSCIETPYFWVLMKTNLRDLVLPSSWFGQNE